MPREAGDLLSSAPWTFSLELGYIFNGFLVNEPEQCSIIGERVNGAESLGRTERKDRKGKQKWHNKLREIMAVYLLQLDILNLRFTRGKMSDFFLDFEEVSK